MPEVEGGVEEAIEVGEGHVDGDPREELARLSGILEGNGIAVHSAQQETLTLEDVFIQIVEQSRRQSPGRAGAPE